MRETKSLKAKISVVRKVALKLKPPSEERTSTKIIEKLKADKDRASTYLDKGIKLPKTGFSENEDDPLHRK